MKLILEHYEEQYTIETSRSNYDIHEVIDLVERLLLSAGYHPESVKDGFIAKADEIEEEINERI